MFQRIKSWMRQTVSSKPPVQMSRRPVTIRDGAAQLVDRARQGDQNAIALICQVRDNAKAGMSRAQRSVKAIAEYIQSNPHDGEATMGGELAVEAKANKLAKAVCDSCFEGDYVETVRELVPELVVLSIPKAVVALAEGPSLLNKDESTFIAETFKSLTENERAAFKKGYEQGIGELATVPSKLQCAYLLGHVIGTAKAIQAVRLPRVPISVYAPKTGYELGERRKSRS